MENIYLIENKDKIYKCFDNSNLLVIIEIFFNSVFKRYKPIKIQKYMTIGEIPDKLVDLCLLNDEISNLYTGLNKCNQQNLNSLYKSSIEIEITIIDDLSLENKIKLSYSKKIIP